MYLLFVLSASAKEAEPNLKVKSFKRVQLGSHMVVQTEGDGADELDAVELAGKEMARDGLVYTFSDAPNSGAPSAIEVDSFFDVWPDAIELEDCDEAPCAWAFAGGDERGTVQARIGADDALDFRVTVHDATLVAELADKDDLKLSWSSDDDRGNNLKPDSVVSLWSATVDATDSTVAQLVAYDTKGDAVDRLTETVTTSDAEVTDSVYEVTLTEVGTKAYALDVIIDSTADVIVDGSVTSGSDILLSASSGVPTQTESQFVLEGLTVYDTDTAYEMKLKFVLDDGTVESTTVTSAFKDGATTDFDWGAVRADLNDGGDVWDSRKTAGSSFDLLVALAADVRSVELTFSSGEGFELTPTAQWHRHTLAFETKKPIQDEVLVDIELHTVDGKSLDVIAADDDVGTIYAAFGKGTTNSASNSGAKPELL